VPSAWQSSRRPKWPPSFRNNWHICFTAGLSGFISLTKRTRGRINELLLSLLLV
jgi:hypothetical protein